MQNRVLPYNTIGNRRTPNSYVGYQGYVSGDQAGPKPPQSVAEILSQGLPEMMPDLGGASSTADRKREIADLLTQRAMGRNATSIGTGLAQLGEAFIARGATKRADEAETTRDSITRDLLATAMGGGPDAARARAQLTGGDVAGTLARFDAQQAAQAEAAKPQYQEVGDALLRIGPDGVTPVYEAPQAPPEAPKPIEVNGVLLDPITYKPIADYRTPTQTGGLTDYQRQELALRQAEAERNSTRPREKDPNGVLRYLDGAQEPVFSNVTTAPAPAKPLIGAESMGRVAAGLPNMRQAVTDLKSALGVNIQGGTATTSEGGYRPDQDWGALVLDNIPFTGDVIARVAGGEDYQKFDNAYSTFEAAALPIMSGAAVTDSEAKRALKALRVRIGDTDQAVARKMANMDRMVSGLEAAARGDTAALQSIVGVVNSGSTTTAANGLPPGFIVIE